MRGRKCHLGISYLGHVFSGSGMAPDKQKVSAVQEWPTIDIKGGDWKPRTAFFASKETIRVVLVNTFV